jgi:hypothetical protein
MAARAKISKQHLHHWFNFEIILHKNFLVNSVHKLFRLSCPLFSNCAFCGENGLHFDLFLRWVIQGPLVS